MLFLKFIFEREREIERMSRRGTEREGDTESKASSRPWAVSTEPDTGLEPTNHEITTWAEVWCLANWATQALLSGDELLTSLEQELGFIVFIYSHIIWGELLSSEDYTGRFLHDLPCPLSGVVYWHLCSDLSTDLMFKANLFLAISDAVFNVITDSGHSRHSPPTMPGMAVTELYFLHRAHFIFLPSFFSPMGEEILHNFQ